MLVALLFVAVSLVVQRLAGPGADTGLFDSAGRELLSRHAMQTFANPTIQSGPLFLLLVGVGSMLAQAVGLPGWVGASVFTALVIAALAWAIGRRLVTRKAASAHHASGALVAVGLSAAIALAAALGHPDDLIVGLVIILAAARMFEGSGTTAGVVLGVAIGIKLWAVLAIGVLAMRGWKAMARALPFSVLIAALCYGPFVVFGTFGTFRFAWQVESEAPIGFFIPDGHAFPWSLRLLQACAAVAVGIVLAYKARSPDVVWLVPAAVVATRLLLDPRSIDYYWSPVIASLAIGTWLLRDTRALTRGIVLFCWVVPVQLSLVATTGVAGRVVGTIFGVGVLALAFVRLGPRSATAQGQPAITGPM